jgi:hypothetical protein
MHCRKVTIDVRERRLDPVLQFQPTTANGTLPVTHSLRLEESFSLISEEAFEVKEDILNRTVKHT